MDNYSITQWILFFLWYCFLGWIWECFYVSAKNAWKHKKWKFINRGFLHGPLIPIYGFASIAILVSTIHLREDMITVYVIGAMTATLFELVTGTAIEYLFKVKYWDYSDLPLNYKGHICLIVSLFWGFLSVLLVQVIHVPIEKLLFSAPELPCKIAAFVLMALFTYDATTSFNEAMDLRKVLESLTENNEMLGRLERRFDAIVAFTPVPDIDDLRELKLNAKKEIIYNVEKLRWKTEKRIDSIKKHLQLPEFDELADRIEVLDKLEMVHKKIFERTNQQYVHAKRQLKRNPGVKSERYQEMLDLLNEIFKNRD